MRNEGGGLMLWIMFGPGRGIKTTIRQFNRENNIRTEEGIHGEDHPGNQ
jgi:hypothetical protein